ncbi:uncharacterized protein isoform X1 [Rhodnius prolixus]|uniref:uncharacterized protein isoform X1 n=1 Tax=Rhodnius prolixus TaxID=13249 RepID=UPI003D18895D
MDSSFNRGPDSFEDSDVSNLLNGENIIRKEVSINEDSEDIRPGKTKGIIGWTLEHISDNSVYIENEANTTMSNFSGNSSDPVVDFIDLTFNQEGNKSNFGTTLREIKFPRRIDKGIQGEISGSKKRGKRKSIIRLILPPISKDCYEKNLENGKLYLKPSKVDLINVKVDTGITTSKTVNSAHLTHENTLLGLNDSVKLKNNILPQKLDETSSTWTLQSTIGTIDTSFKSSSAKQTHQKYSCNNSSSSNNDDDLFDHPESSNFVSDRITNSLFEPSNVSLIENNFEFVGDSISQSVLNDDALVSHEVEIVDEGVSYGINEQYNSLPLVTNTNFESGQNISSLSCATPLTFPAEALHALGSEEFVTNKNEKLNQNKYSQNKETTLRSFIEKDVLDLIKDENEEVFEYSLQVNSDHHQPNVENFSHSHNHTFSQRDNNYDSSNNVGDVLSQNVNSSNSENKTICPNNSNRLKTPEVFEYSLQVNSDHHQPNVENFSRSHNHTFSQRDNNYDSSNNVGDVLSQNVNSSNSENKTICPDNSNRLITPNDIGNQSLSVSKKSLTIHGKNEEEEEIPIRKPTGLSMPIIDLSEDSGVEDLSINEKVICPKDLILEAGKKSQCVKLDKFRKSSGLSKENSQRTFRTSSTKSRRSSEKYESKIVPVKSAFSKKKNVSNSNLCVTTTPTINLCVTENIVSDSASPKLVTAENSKLLNAQCTKDGKQIILEKEEKCESINNTNIKNETPVSNITSALPKENEMKEIAINDDSDNVNKLPSSQLLQENTEKSSKSVQDTGNLFIDSHPQTSNNKSNIKQSKENLENFYENLPILNCQEQATPGQNIGSFSCESDSFANVAADSQPRINVDKEISKIQVMRHERLKSNTTPESQTVQLPMVSRLKDQVICDTVTKETPLEEVVQDLDQLPIKGKRPKMPIAQQNRKSSPSKKASSVENLNEISNFEEPGIHYMLPQSQRLEILNRFPNYLPYNNKSRNTTLNKKKSKSMTPNMLNDSILNDSYSDFKIVCSNMNDRNIKLRRHSMLPSLENSRYGDSKGEILTAERRRSEDCFNGHQENEQSQRLKSDSKSFVQLVINNPIQVYNVSESGKSINEIAKKLVQKQELFAASKERKDYKRQKNEECQQYLKINEMFSKEKEPLSELEPEEVEKKYLDKLKQNIKVFKRNTLAATKHDMLLDIPGKLNLNVSQNSKSSKCLKSPIESSYITNELEIIPVRKNSFVKDELVVHSKEDLQHPLNLKTELSKRNQSKNTTEQKENIKQLVSNVRTPHCKNLENVVNMLKDHIKENEGILSNELVGAHLNSPNETDSLLAAQNKVSLKQNSSIKLSEVQSTGLSFNCDLNKIGSELSPEIINSKTTEVPSSELSQEIINSKTTEVPSSELSQEIINSKTSEVPGSELSQEIINPKTTEVPGSELSQEIINSKTSEVPGSELSQEIINSKTTEVPGGELSHEIINSKTSEVPGSELSQEIINSKTSEVPGSELSHEIINSKTSEVPGSELSQEIINSKTSEVPGSELSHEIINSKTSEVPGSELSHEIINSKTSEVPEKLDEDVKQNGPLSEPFSSPIISKTVKDSYPLRIMCSISCERIEESLFKTLWKVKTDSVWKSIETRKFNHIDDNSCSKVTNISVIDKDFSQSEHNTKIIPDSETGENQKEGPFAHFENNYVSSKKYKAAKNNDVLLCDNSLGDLTNLEGETLAINVVGLEVECGNSSSGSCFGSPTGKQESPETKGGRRKKGIPKRVTESLNSSFSSLDENVNEERQGIMNENLEKDQFRHEDDLKERQDGNKANIVLAQEVGSNSTTKATKNANILLKKTPVRRGRKKKKGKKEMNSENYQTKALSVQELPELREEPCQKVLTKKNKSKAIKNIQKDLEKTVTCDASKEVKPHILSECDNLNTHPEKIIELSQNEVIPYSQEITVETSDDNDSDNKSLENIEMPVLQAETYVTIDTVCNADLEIDKLNESMMDIEDNKAELSMPPVLTKEGSKSPPHVRLVAHKLNSIFEETANMTNRLKTKSKQERVPEDSIEITSSESVPCKTIKSELKPHYNGTLTVKTKTHLTGKVLAKSTNFINNKGVILGKCINPDNSVKKQHFIKEEKSNLNNKPLRTNGIHSKVYNSQKSQEEDLKDFGVEQKNLNSENFKKYINETNNFGHTIKPFDTISSDIYKTNENVLNIHDEDQFCKFGQDKQPSLTSEDFPKKLLLPDLETIGTSTENTAALHGIISELEETLLKLKDESNTSIDMKESQVEENKLGTSFQNCQNNMSNALDEKSSSEVMKKDKITSDNLKISEAVIISNSLENIENLCRTISEDNSENAVNYKDPLNNSLKEEYVNCEDSQLPKSEGNRTPEKNLIKDDAREVVEELNLNKNSTNGDSTIDNTLKNQENNLQNPTKEIMTKKRRLLQGIPLNGTSSIQEKLSDSPTKSTEMDLGNTFLSQNISSSEMKLSSSKISEVIHEKENSKKHVKEEKKEVTNSMLLLTNTTLSPPKDNIRKGIIDIENKSKSKVVKTMSDVQVNEIFPTLFKELKLKQCNVAKKVDVDITTTHVNRNRKRKTKLVGDEPKDNLINISKGVSNKLKNRNQQSRSTAKEVVTKSKHKQIIDPGALTVTTLKPSDQNIDSIDMLKKGTNKKDVKSNPLKSKIRSAATNISDNKKAESLISRAVVPDRSLNTKQDLDSKKSSTGLRSSEQKNTSSNINKKGKKGSSNQKKLNKLKNFKIFTEKSSSPIKSQDHKAMSPQKASRSAKNSVKGGNINKSTDYCSSLNAVNNNSINVKPDLEAAKNSAILCQDNSPSKKMNHYKEKRKISSGVHCEINSKPAKKNSKGIIKKGKKTTLSVSSIALALNDNTELITSTKSSGKKKSNSKKSSKPNNQDRITDKYLLKDINHLKLKELINGAKKMLNKKRSLMVHSTRQVSSAADNCRIKQGIYLKILGAEMGDHAAVTDISTRITADERITAEALLNLSKIVEINEHHYNQSTSAEIQTNLELLPSELRNIVGSAFIENSKINDLGHNNAKSLKAMKRTNSFLTSNTNFTFCRNHFYRPSFLNLTLFRKNNLEMTDSLYKVASLVLYFLSKKMHADNDYRSIASTSRDISVGNPIRANNSLGKNLNQVLSMGMMHFSEGYLNNATISYDREKHRKRIIFSIEQFRFLTDLIKMISCAPLKLQLDTLVNRINGEQTRSEVNIERKKAKRNGYPKRLKNLHQNCKLDGNKPHSEDRLPIIQSTASTCQLVDLDKESCVLPYFKEPIFGQNALAAVSAHHYLKKQCTNKPLFDIKPNLRFTNLLSNVINIKYFFTLNFPGEFYEMFCSSRHFRNLKFNCRELLAKKSNIDFVEDSVVTKLTSERCVDTGSSLLEQNGERSSFWKSVRLSKRLTESTSKEMVIFKSTSMKKCPKSNNKIDGIYLKRIIEEMWNSDLFNFSRSKTFKKTGLISVPCKVKLPFLKGHMFLNSDRRICQKKKTALACLEFNKNIARNGPRHMFKRNKVQTSIPGSSKYNKKSKQVTTLETNVLLGRKIIYSSEIRSDKSFASVQKPLKCFVNNASRNGIQNLKNVWEVEKNNAFYSSFLHQENIALPSTSLMLQTETAATSEKLLPVDYKTNFNHYSTLNDFWANKNCIIDALWPSRNNFTSDIHECEISFIVYNADVRIWINNLLNHFQSVHNHFVASNVNDCESLEILISEPHKKYAIVTIMWPNQFTKHINHSEHYVKIPQNRSSSFFHQFLIYDYNAQLFADIMAQNGSNFKIFEYSSNWTKVKLFGPILNETYFSLNRSSGLLSNLINSFWESQSTLGETQMVIYQHEMENHLYEFFKLYRSECVNQGNNVTITDECIEPSHVVQSDLNNVNEKALFVNFDERIVTSNNTAFLRSHLPSTSKDLPSLKNKTDNHKGKNIKNSLKYKSPKTGTVQKEKVDKGSKIKVQEIIKFKTKAKTSQSIRKFVKKQKSGRNCLKMNKYKTKKDNSSMIPQLDIEFPELDYLNEKTEAESKLSYYFSKNPTVHGAFSKLHHNNTGTSTLTLLSNTCARERKCKVSHNLMLCQFNSALRRLLNPTTLFTSRYLETFHHFSCTYDPSQGKTNFSLVNKHSQNLTEFNLLENLLNLENTSYSKAIIFQEDSQCLQTSTMEISLVPTKVIVDITKSKNNLEHNMNMFQNRVSEPFISRKLNEEIKKRGSKRRLECCAEGTLPVKVNCYGSIADSKDNTTKQYPLISDEETIDFMAENNESNSRVSLACHLYLEVKKLNKNLYLPNRIGEMPSSSQNDYCGNTSQLLNMTTSIRDNVEIILQDRIFYSNVNTLPLSTHNRITISHPLVLGKYVKNCSDMKQELKVSKNLVARRGNGVSARKTFIQNNVDNDLSISACSSSTLFPTWELNPRTITQLIESKHLNGLNSAVIQSSNMLQNKHEELYSAAEQHSNILSFPTSHVSYLKMLTIQLLSRQETTYNKSLHHSLFNLITENDPLIRENCGILNVELNADNLNYLSSESQLFKRLSAYPRSTSFPYLQVTSDTQIGSEISKNGSSSKAEDNQEYLLKNEDLRDKTAICFGNVANPLCGSDPISVTQNNEFKSNRAHVSNKTSTKISKPNGPALELKEEFCTKEVPLLSNNEKLNKQTNSAVSETSSTNTDSSVTENESRDRIDTSVSLSSETSETGFEMNKTDDIFFDHGKVKSIRCDDENSKSNSEVEEECLTDEEESLVKKSRIVIPEKKLPVTKIMVSERYISNPYKESVVKFSKSDYDIYSPYSLKKDGSFLSSYNLKKRALESSYKCTILERKDFIKSDSESTSVPMLRKSKINSVDDKPIVTNKLRRRKGIKKSMELIKTKINSKLNPYVRLKYIHISRVQDVLKEFNLKKITLPLEVCRMLSINEKACRHRILSKKWITFYADAQNGSSQKSNKTFIKREVLTSEGIHHQRQCVSLVMSDKSKTPQSSLVNENSSKEMTTKIKKRKSKEGRQETNISGMNEQSQSSCSVESKIVTYISTKASKEAEILKDFVNSKVTSQEEIQSEIPKVTSLEETFRRKQTSGAEKDGSTFENKIAMSTKILTNPFEKERVEAYSSTTGSEITIPECSSDSQSNNPEILDSTICPSNQSDSIEKIQEEPVTSSGLQSYEDDSECEEQSKDDQTVHSMATSSSSKLSIIQDKYHLSTESLDLIRTFFEGKGLKKQNEETVSSSGLRNENFDEDSIVESSSEGSYVVEEKDNKTDEKTVMSRAKTIEDLTNLQTQTDLHSTGMSEKVESTGSFSRIRDSLAHTDQIQEVTNNYDATVNNSVCLEEEDNTNKNTKIHSELSKMHFLSENSSFNKYYAPSTSQKGNQSSLYSHVATGSLSNFSFLSSCEEKSNLSECTMDDSSRNTSNLDEDDFSCDPEFLSPLFDYSKMNLQYLSSIFEKEPSQSSKEIVSNESLSFGLKDFSGQFSKSEKDISALPTVSGSGIPSDRTGNIFDSKSKILDRRKSLTRKKALRSKNAEQRNKDGKRQKRKLSPVQTEPTQKKHLSQEEFDKSQWEDVSRVGRDVKGNFNGFNVENEQCTCATEERQWQCSCLRSSYHKKKILFKLIKQLLIPDDKTDRLEDKGRTENMSRVPSETLGSSFGSISSVHRPFKNNSLARFPLSECMEKEMDEDSVITDDITSAVTDVLVTSSSPCEIVLGIPTTRSLHNVKDTYKKSLRTRKRQRKVSEIGRSDETLIGAKKENNFLGSFTSRLVSSKELDLVVHGSSEVNRKSLVVTEGTSTQDCYEPANSNFYLICQGTQTEVPRRVLLNDNESSCSQPFEKKSSNTRHESNIERYWRILREPSSSSDESDNEDSRKKHKRKKRKLNT